jgi:hypothetical protein
MTPPLDDVPRIFNADDQHLESDMQTIHIHDNDNTNTHTTPKVMSPPTPVPSPLLCSRWTFLALLIFASKFSQDKCCSNRAWAKLCGLPSCEISRYKHALGLWVRKNHSGSAPSPAPPPHRTVVRSPSVCVNLEDQADGHVS